ncbi:unnamed protein product [Brugia pahangi]|uniref:Protein quiver n=1 Tax=Brugia pahangi TaxID=6280 RepID=A0A0N4T519_BRUPA|nr:unnamed protein product [Brugia pahangi]
MRLFFEIYALFWIPLDGKCYKLMLDCNKTYDLMNAVESIAWPDICRRNNAIMNCKYVRVYPQQQKSTEMSITCVNGDVCYQTGYSDLCYYMVIDSDGVVYHTCTCCGQLCGEEIQQPRSQDIRTMLAKVNSFWIVSDISAWSIIFMLIIIFANLCIFITIFDDLTCLCIFIWAYLAKLCDFHLKLPRLRKLKQMAQFLDKHKLSAYYAPRNVFIFMETHSRSFLNARRAQEARYLACLRRDYQNIQTQAKNILHVHYLIKKIAAAHSVRIRLDDLRSMDPGLSTQETRSSNGS